MSKTPVYGLAIGDSIPAGYGVSSGEEFPALIANNLSETVINQAVTGHKSYETLWNLESAFSSHQADNVYFGTGINDILAGYTVDFNLNCVRQIVAGIKRINGNCNIYLIGPNQKSPGIVWNTFHYWAHMYEQNAMRIMAVDSSVKYVDAYGLFYQKGGSVAGHEALFVDAYHPNASGHELLAEEIIII